MNNILIKQKKMYILSYYNSKIKACNFPCLECSTNADNCTKCIDGETRDLSNNCTCKIGFLDILANKCQSIFPNLIIEKSIITLYLYLVCD